MASSRGAGVRALRHVLLLQRDVPQAAKFYADGLGMKVVCCSERWAELSCESGSTTIALKQADGEAPVSTGYSPLLWFSTADVAALAARALQMGATLDGPIRHEANGKVAALRAPDGHMIGLVEVDEADFH